MKYTLLLLILLLILLSIKLNAQDTIITIKKDTIKCKIEKNFKKVVTYRLAEMPMWLNVTLKKENISKIIRGGKVVFLQDSTKKYFKNNKKSYFQRLYKPGPDGPGFGWGLGIKAGIMFPSNITQFGGGIELGHYGQNTGFKIEAQYFNGGVATTKTIIFLNFLKEKNLYIGAGIGGYYKKIIDNQRKKKFKATINILIGFRHDKNLYVEIAYISSKYPNHKYVNANIGYRFAL